MQEVFGKTNIFDKKQNKTKQNQKLSAISEMPSTMAGAGKIQNEPRVFLCTDFCCYYTIPTHSTSFFLKHNLLVFTTLIKLKWFPTAYNIKSNLYA